MTIEFNCPHCAKLLKTADDKAGVNARCPGCGQTIMVPMSSGGDGGGVDAGAGDEYPIPPPPRGGFADEIADDRRVSEPATSGSSGSGNKKCPMCGAQIKAAAKICRFCGEEQAGGSTRRERSFQTPHRGAVILVLGIVSWPLSCLGMITSIIAWVMANQDLKEMDAGRMDPEGRGLTQAGKIVGIVHLCFFGFITCIYAIFIVFVIGAGGMR